VTPKHLRALELDYEGYIRLNGGEHCGLCGNPPPEGRKLYRDHWHKGPLEGQPRGLLCYRDNKFLPYWATIEWLLLAIAYLKRAQDREDRAAHMDVGA
jgi:hypothetical protein